MCFFVKWWFDCQNVFSVFFSLFLYHLLSLHDKKQCCARNLVIKLVVFPISIDSRWNGVNKHIHTCTLTYTRTNAHEHRPQKKIENQNSKTVATTININMIIKIHTLILFRCNSLQVLARFLFCISFLHALQSFSLIHIVVVQFVVRCSKWYGYFVYSVFCFENAHRAQNIYKLFVEMFRLNKIICYGHINYDRDEQSVSHTLCVLCVLCLASLCGMF